MMEKMKNRREGKKSAVMMKTVKERAEAMKGREEEKKKREMGSETV